MGGGGSTQQQSSSVQHSEDDGLEVQERAGGAKIVFGSKLLEVAKQAELQQQVDARRLARRQERESYRYPNEDEDEEDEEDDEEDEDEDEDEEEDDDYVHDTRTRSSNQRSAPSSSRHHPQLSSPSSQQEEITRATPEQAVKAAENAFNSFLENRQQTRNDIEKEVDSRFIRSEPEMIHLEDSKLEEVLREVRKIEETLQYRFGF